MLGEVTYQGKLHDGSGDFRLETPCPHMRSVQLLVDHKQTNNGVYETSVTLKHDRYGTSKIEHSLRMRPFETSLRVNAPCEYMRDASIEIKHDGHLLNFVNSAVLRYNMLDSDVSYQGRLRDWNGEWTLTTPCPYMRSTRLALDHDVRGFANYQTKVEFEHDLLGTSTVAHGLTLESPFAFNLELETPHRLARHVELELRHRGDDVFDFENSAVFKHNLLQGDVQYQGKLRDWNGELRLTSSCPYLKQVSLALEHENQPQRNYQTKVTFDHELLGMYTVSHDLALQQPFHTKLEINTPHSEARTVTLEVNHDGSSVYSFKHDARFVLNDDITYAYQGEFADWDGSFSVQTPHRGVRTMNIELKNDVSTHDQIRVKSELKWTVENRVEIESVHEFQQYPLIVKSQTTMLGSSFTLDLEPNANSDWQNDYSLSVKVDRDEFLSADVRFQPQAFEMSMTFLGPTGLHVDAKFNGDVSSSFNLDTNVVLEGKTWLDSSMAFTMAPTKLEIKLDRLYTEWFAVSNSEISAEFQGNAQNFQTVIKAAINGKQGQLQVDFKRRPMNVKVRLQTPFRNYEDLSAMYNHRASANSFNSHAEVTCS